MATLVSRATGNWLTASTWALCDATAELDSETGYGYTTTSYVASAAFTPGAITVDGLLLKLQYRNASPSGTFSVELYNSSGAVSVASVTINVSDLPNYQSYNLGWFCFPISAVTLAVATNYQVRVKSSVASQVAVYRDGTTSNWSRQLRTTTQQAPAAGDKLIVAGELTGAGTGNSFTVTMDETSTSTVYGNVSFLQSIGIGRNAKLAYGTSASTAYYLKVAGLIRIFPGGEFTIGVSGTAIPSSSTADLKFSVATNVDSGLFVGKGGTFKTCGQSLAYHRTKLAADVAAAATSATTADSTGWKSGDVVVFPSTTRTSTQIETVTLNADASGTSLAWTGGLTNAHGGNATTGVQADLFNLTRNVRISGTSVTLCAYILAETDAILTMAWTESYWLGSGTSNKEGITSQTTSGTFSVVGCTMHDFHANGFAIRLLGSAGNGSIAIADNCTYGGSYGVHSGGSTIVDVSITGNVFSKYTGNCTFSNSRMTIQNNVFTSAAVVIFSPDAAPLSGVVSNNAAYSLSGVGVQLDQYRGGTFDSFCIWRCNNYGLYISQGTLQNATISNLRIFGNANSNIYWGGFNTGIIISGATIDSGATLTSPVGITLAGQMNDCLIEDSVFGGNTTHSTADILISSISLNYQQRLSLNDVTLNSAAPIGTPNNLTEGSYLFATKLGGTVGNNKSWYRYGTVISDTTNYGGTTFSVRTTPTGGTGSYVNTVVGRTAIANGGSTTVTIKVRKSQAGDGQAYNGANLALYVRRNNGAGITADTLLATSTAAAGSWDTLTGSVGPVTNDTVLEFFVRCDGNAGWANVANFTCTTILNSKSLRYWGPSQIFSNNDNSAGGGAYVFG